MAILTYALRKTIFLTWFCPRCTMGKFITVKKKFKEKWNFD